MSRVTAQLTLDLGHRTALGREDFLVAPCNRDAVAWIDRWPDWPAPALVVYGPPACGKSHLAAVWRGRADAVELSPDRLDAGPEALLAGRDAALIDGADRVTGGAAADALFHLYNHLDRAGGGLLLTARAAPSRWPLALADLRSRVLAAPAVGIGAPDDDLLAGLLVKLFADRQLRVGTELIGWLVDRIERTPAAVRDAVAALDAAALARGGAVTTALARAVLPQLEARWTGQDNTNGED